MRTTAVLGRGRKQLPAETEPVQTAARWNWTPTVSRKPSHDCFLSCEAETARDTHLKSGEFIDHCHNQETAQLHQDAQDAVETDRKELDEVQADAGRTSIHRSKRGRRGAGEMQIAKRSCDPVRCSKKWTVRKPTISSDTG